MIARGSSGIADKVGSLEPGKMASVGDWAGMTVARDRIMAAQQEISYRKNQLEIGKIVDVLIEQENPDTGELIGRSARFAPDVDGVVYVSDPQGKASLGSMFSVKITSADHYDLFGEII